MENNEAENKNNINKVYTEKSIKLLKICEGLILFDFLTYIIGLLIYNSFDFGFIFEGISFVAIVMTTNSIEKQSYKLAKKEVIVSMIPICALILYDIVLLLIDYKRTSMVVMSYYIRFNHTFEYFLIQYFFDIILLAIIILLYKTYTSIKRLDGSDKDKSYTDIFYDNL